MLNFLRRKRSELNEWLTARHASHTFSLPVYQLHRQTLTLIEQHGASPCLDAGAGRSPWKPFLESRGLRVTSLDVEERAGQIDLLADVQDMPEVPDESFATVLCTQVLEHTPRPWSALSEIARVLTPGGHLIASVPHLSVIHEAPHDYYRFTRFGLANLLEASELEVVLVEEAGGLLSFLSHAFSMLFFCSLAAIPGLRFVAWKLNYTAVRLLAPLDRWFGARRIYPCNYVVVARKRKSRCTG